MIAATVLRRLGQLEAILGTFMDRMPSKDKGRLLPILLGGVAQLVFLAMPPHAVINIAVEQCRRDRREARFSGLVNAVLRRVSEQGEGIAAAQDQVRANVPDWLWSRWTKTYGEHLARAIGEGSLREAPLDITAKGDAATWAERLSGRLLPTGSIRVAAEGRVENLPGFAEGAWWVQDAAAALPARLFGRVEGKDIADLCAAPGGKTAQLAAQGARVTAVDIGPQRLDRLRSNLARLALEADVIEADATAWAPGRRFDGVLLDAPCLATGAVRRHPDILRLKRADDLGRLTEIQARLLDNAAQLVKPGGTLVYCTCSLEPEEGPHQVARVLGRSADWARAPIDPAEIGVDPSWLTSDGDLRTLPSHLRLEPPEFSGIDGFYAARLVRQL